MAEWEIGQRPAETKVSKTRSFNYILEALDYERTME
jgi:hypothetical protein